MRPPALRLLAHPAATQNGFSKEVSVDLFPADRRSTQNRPHVFEVRDRRGNVYRLAASQDLDDAVRTLSRGGWYSFRRILRGSSSHVGA